MPSSSANSPRRSVFSQAIIPIEHRPSTIIREPVLAGKEATFDPLAFLIANGVGKKILNFEKNEVIFATGETAGYVLYIEKGVVSLSVISDRGKKAVITVLGPGNFLGIWCLAGQVRRTATATALGPTTVRLIPKVQMLQLLRTKPAFSEYFISFLLKRNIQIGQQIIDLFFDPTEKRLIRTLLFLAQFGAKNGDDVTLSRVPQELLAEMIGSTRTHVNGFMAKLKRLGFVRYDGGKLTVHRTPLMSLL
jgi:CRP/FNR family cyclic AMP-dependent transcriptional regulator